MTPPQAQLQTEQSSSAGMSSILVRTAPGAQGAGVFGMQGCGVSTPSATAVAAATCGLDGVMHMPKGMMLSIGTWSWIVADQAPSSRVRFVGNTPSRDGDVPNEHVSCAPSTTW